MTTQPFGQILEDLERTGICPASPAQQPRDLPPTEVIEWYECAKDGLRRAHALDVGVPEAAAEYVAAREAMRRLFEALWPGQKV